MQGKLIVGKRYTGKLEERKEMVVRFAQEILVALTGEKGLFDTKIAFTGKKGGSSEIHYVNFDGTEPVKLTNYRTITLSPKWSPDGKQISFLSYKDGAPDLLRHGSQPPDDTEDPLDGPSQSSRAPGRQTRNGCS